MVWESTKVYASNNVNSLMKEITEDPVDTSGVESTQATGYHGAPPKKKDKKLYPEPTKDQDARSREQHKQGSWLEEMYCC